MPLLSKASNVVPNVFFRDDVTVDTGDSQIGHWIPFATNCRMPLSSVLGYQERRSSYPPQSVLLAWNSVAESQLTDAAKRVSAAGPLEKPSCR